MTLYEYAARRVTPESENQQTAMLGGHALGPSLSRETLEIAKQHLKTYFRVVGLTEHFDASLLLLGRALAWGMPFYLRENVTREKPIEAEIEPRARAVIAELNALDLELYAFARELFEYQCRAYGEGLSQDLARFRKWNERYQQIVQPVTRLRQKVHPRRVLLR
jgi:hypothetical protein